VEDSELEGLLVQADQQLVKQSEMTTDLGESSALGEKEEAEFARILVRDPRKISKTIQNVVKYLGGTIKGRQTLSDEQMDEARKWYIDTTALVLGRFAYDDTMKDMRGDGAALDTLRARGEDAERSMDQMDAARHLHKMGADDMIDHNVPNIMNLLKRTGRLARFLSEIEATEMRSQHPSQTKRSQEYVKNERHSLHQMEKHEGEITAAIDELMKKVELGDAITGKKRVQATGATSTKTKLTNELMDAAGKEDQARIVQAAGKVAETKIMKAMKFSNRNHPDHVRQVHEPPGMVAEQGPTPNQNVEAPVGLLGRHVSTAVNAHLDSILKLFNTRKAQKKNLSMEEHKAVNQELRGITAQLMQKYMMLPAKHNPEAEDQDDVHVDKVAPASAKEVARNAKTAKLFEKAFKMPLFKARAALLRNAKPVLSHKNEKQAEMIAKSFGMPLAKARATLLKNNKQTASGEGLFNQPHKPTVLPDGPGIEQSGFAKMLTMPLNAAKKFVKTGKTPKNFKTKPVKKVLKDAAPEARQIPKPKHIGEYKAKDAAGKVHTWSHKGEVQKEEKAMAAGNAEAPSQKGKAATDSIVKQFIYHTLGQKNVVKVNTPSTLADLLKHGVRLETGGMLHFMAPFREE